MKCASGWLLGVRRFEKWSAHQLLDMKRGIEHWKAKGLDFSRLFHRPVTEAGVRPTSVKDPPPGAVLDHELIAKAASALAAKRPVAIEARSSTATAPWGDALRRVARRSGHAGLPEDTIHVNFKGTAGGSFGAWLAHGITFELEGDANDYVGKGLSGGRLVISPPKESTLIPEENIIVGNTVMYGAISGEAHFRRVAGERLCVRNSGTPSVVEGVGDHGC